jgi:hypothetical protein
MPRTRNKLADAEVALDDEPCPKIGPTVIAAVLLLDGRSPERGVTPAVRLPDCHAGALVYSYRCIEGAPWEGLLLA